MGDFNEILYSHEKEGGRRRPNLYMQAFRDGLADCDLEDLGFIGNPFTWKRGRIRERLDRAVVNNQWRLMHPGASLRHLDFIKSDHRPILLDTEDQPEVQQQQGPKRFEARWIHEKNFRDTVVQAWTSAGFANTGGVLNRLGRMHEALHAWDRSILKKPKRRLRDAQRKLENAMNGPLTEENENLAKEMASLVELLLEQEEMHWFQRSRSNWLQLGDRNTSFFHHYASARRRKNYIKKLLNDDNDWVEGTSALKPLILDYFSNLFFVGSSGY
jgi:hypothetical protein